MSATIRKKGSPPREGITITHPERMLFPEMDIAKGEVADYYRKIARRLLPHLRNRPITLERCPEGVGLGKKHFFQKDIPDTYPDWIPRVALPTEQGEVVHYALINDLATLLYLVNQGALTFHVWLSRVGRLDRPDFVLFDLDPGPAGFATVVRIAFQLRAILQKKKAKAFLKTSGQSGLHVVVPWTARGGYLESRTWARGVAEEVVAALPDDATLEVRKAERGERVFVDVLHNSRGHHVVPPYVLRPVPEASISMPLNWAELTLLLEPEQYNLRTIFEHLAKQKRDPLAALVRSWSQPRRGGVG
jgi:bifunctional non-homologous end joining protein LigD